MSYCRDVDWADLRWLNAATFTMLVSYILRVVRNGKSVAQVNVRVTWQERLLQLVNVKASIKCRRCPISIPASRQQNIRSIAPSFTNSLRKSFRDQHEVLLESHRRRSWVSGQLRRIGMVADMLPPVSLPRVSSNLDEALSASNDTRRHTRCPSRGSCQRGSSSRRSQAVLVRRSGKECHVPHRRLS